MRRVLVRTACAAGLVLLAAAALFGWSWMRGGSSYELSAEVRAAPLADRFRTWPEHDAIYRADDAPYVVQIETSHGALCSFGTFHTLDADHPHRTALAQRWRAFRPTVALAEGRARGHFVRRPLFDLLPQGEPALVHALGRADGVPIWSLEPPYADEVTALIADSTPERVALYFALRVYWAEAGGRADEGLFLDLLAKRSDTPALRGALTDLAAVDAVWAPLAAEHGDWRTRTGEPRGTWLEELSERSRIVRGEHMVRLCTYLVLRGERVFAAVGRSHVIRHELALRAALRPEPEHTR